MANKKTPAECFAALRPALMDMARLINSAPCNQVGLAVMVAAHMFGVAGAAMGKDSITGAREVADLIVETMRTVTPKLKVVP